MQDQPKAKPYRSSAFFRDGLASRPPVEGTVARGFLRSDKELYTGKKSTPSTSSPGATQGTTTMPPATSTATTTIATSAPGATTTSAAQVTAAYPDDVDKFPFPITEDILNRGQQRFEIFCSVCHGLTGEGDGMIVRRGFRKPPSYHEQRLRDAPVGHFFDVVTNGWGAMPSYASQVPVEDRWAIIAYIRALQLSRTATTAAATDTSGVRK
jgi:mono/diheme cytochrome c family protein